MTVVGVLGDVHGTTQAVISAIARTSKAGGDTVYQLGDFGIWPGVKGERFIDQVSAFAVERDVTVRFVDGNHENFDLLYRHEVGGDGFREIRPNLFHIPRGHVWEHDGCWFAAMGGAVSVDKHYRREGLDWFRDEEVIDLDVDRLEDNMAVVNRKWVDVMLSHDCPDWCPVPVLEDDPPTWIPKHTLRRANAHRGMLADAELRCWPRLILHGHYHCHYRAEDRTTRVVGFDRESTPGNFGLLDFDDLDVMVPE